MTTVIGDVMVEISLIALVAYMLTAGYVLGTYHRLVQHNRSVPRMKIPVPDSPEWVLGDNRTITGRPDLYSRPLMKKKPDGRYVVVGYVNDRDAADELIRRLNNETDDDTPSPTTLRITTKESE